MTTSMGTKLQQGDCFKLLAACFYEPDRDFYLQEDLCINLHKLFLACGSISASEAAGKMLTAITELTDEELKVEYARLFVGPFELIAPPYGSIYLEDTRRIMGESTMKVQQMYKEAGLALDVKEAPDHIAFELEFMHYLCLEESRAEADNLGNGVNWFSRMQAEFMMNLLSPWIPAFCQNIRQGTNNSFYTGLSDCLENFIRDIKPQYKIVLPVNGAESSDDCRASA